MKRILTLLLAGGLIVAVVVAWQLPNILRAIPSRYVVRLPEPLQEIGVREHVEILPTAAVTVDISSLGLSSIQPTAQTVVLQPVASPTPPNTITPTPADGIAESSTSAASPTPLPPTFTPTPTLEPTPTPIPFDQAARIRGVQHQYQEWNNCGPATLAMGLSFFGLTYQQGQTASVLKPNPEDRNVSPHEMAAFVNQETNLQAMDRANGNLDIVRQLLTNNIPVIIETGIDPPGEYAWMDWYGHYLLVVAYDDASETVWVYDSWLGTNNDPNIVASSSAEGRTLSYADFDRYWRQFNRNYIAIYNPDQEEELTSIVGPYLDDQFMWESSLERNLAELEQEMDNAFLWFNLGTIYNGLGKYEQAAIAFDQARAIGLPWRMLWYQFGPYEAYYEVGRYQDVIDLADVTLLHRPYFEESYYYRGLAYEALGDVSSARDDLSRASRFNPNYAPAMAALESLDQ